MASPVVPVSMGSPRFTTTEVGAFLVTDAWFPPKASLPAHTHDRPVVGIGLDGALDSRLPGRHLDCLPATLWTEPAGEKHSNRVDEAGAHVLVIQPDPARTELLRPCRDLLDGITHVRNGAFQAMAARALPEISRPDDLSDLALEGLCFEVLAIAGRSHRTRRRQSTPEWLHTARDLLHDRFRENLSLPEVAGIVGVHPGHLSRAFRKRFGTSVARYVRMLRISWGAEQLASTEVPIGIVALRAGFYDQPHFSRAFKRATGQTPGEYRRSASSKGREVVEDLPSPHPPGHDVG